MHRRLRLLKDLSLTLCFLGLLALIVARLEGEGRGHLVAGPLRVVDGDTLAVGGMRLRLAGIDAPELGQTCRREDGGEWPCGEAAKALLTQVLAQGAPECRGTVTDRYRRLLVDCFIDGQNINAQMVRAGLALATGAITFRREQSQAQTARLGLWAGEFDHPRVWRERMGLVNGERERGRIWDDIKSFLALHWL
jgi:endonuclease YncB( thermonuclease family)